MRYAFITLAAASLGWSGALAFGRRHASQGHHVRVMGDHGSVVLSEMDGEQQVHQPHRNRTGRSGKDHGHAFRSLELRQAGGQCGAQYGRCPDDLCCSDYGYCGDSVDHCAPLFDCQPQYGVCGWPRAPPVPSTTSTTAPPPPTTTSTTAPPPPTTTTTTSSSRVTPPPSTTTTSTQAPPTQTGGLRITTNGQCGNGTTCIGNPNYGPCCSQFFWCGSALDFCGAGCHSEFGACLGVPGQPPVSASNVTTIPGPTSTTTRSTTSSSTSVFIPPTTTSTTSRTSTTSTTSAAPTPTVVIPPGFRSSTDGSCGPGVTCLGSTYGRCCSQFGYCGDSDQFCPYIVGCQPEYGYCDPRP